MPADNEMTINERRKYLKRMVERYWKADRRGRPSATTVPRVLTALHRASATVYPYVPRPA